MAKILIIEDDKVLSKMIVEWLTSQHHSVEQAYAGGDGLERLRFYKFDLVILDLELPQMSGIEILRQFRLHSGKIPVLILTGKSEFSNKELGFDAGADDYVTKPFHIKELAARVHALLRRSHYGNQEILRFRHIELNTGSAEVKAMGNSVRLLPKELDLLGFFMRHPNEYFTSEVLLERLWPGQDVSLDAIFTCVKRLRQKLDVEGASIITNTRGLGYKLS